MEAMDLTTVASFWSGGTLDTSSILQRPHLVDEVRPGFLLMDAMLS